MQIATLLSADPILLNKEIESPFGKLGFVFLSSTATPLTTTYATFQDFQTAINTAGMTVSVTCQDSDKHHTLIPEMPVGDLIELSAANEGCIDADTLGVVLTTVELSERGSLNLGANAKTIVNIKNKPTGMVCQIFAVDVEHKVNDAIVYEQRAVIANNEKEFDIHDNTEIALTGSIQQLDLTYSDGRTIRYEAQELALITKDTNEIVANWGGKIQGGSSKFHVIGVENCTTMKVKFTTDSVFYTKKEQPINKFIN